MATIDIKAVYADMLKCAQILEDIGADVKVAYTDMDDFLNKKMVFNGKQIYANWQSDARSVFEEKAKVIVDVFTRVQAECSEASNTLKAVIKEYQNRDSELASTTLGKNIKTKALDFKSFGNMDSADWTGLKKPDYSKVTGVKGNSGYANDRSYFGASIKGKKVTEGKGVNSTASDVGFDRIKITASSSVLDPSKYGLTDMNYCKQYDKSDKDAKLARDVEVEVFAKDGKYYENSGKEFVDVTDKVNKLMSSVDNKKLNITASTAEDIADFFLAVQGGKLYSDTAWNNRVPETELFKSNEIYRYHPTYFAGSQSPFSMINKDNVGLPNPDYLPKSWHVAQTNIVFLSDYHKELQTKIDSLLKSTGADGVEFACKGKYYDINGKDVTSAVLKFQSEAAKQGLQYNYVNENRYPGADYTSASKIMNKNVTTPSNVLTGSSHSTSTIFEKAVSNILSSNPNAFGGATKLGSVITTGFKS